MRPLTLLLAFWFAIATALHPAAAGLSVSNMTGFGVQASTPAPAVTVINRGALTTNASDLTTYTFSSYSIGTASSTRRVIVAVMGDNGTTSSRTLSSVTIGGVSATINVQRTHSAGGSSIAAIASATVPTGTSASIVVTFSGTMLRAAIYAVSVDNLQSVAPVDTASDTLPTLTSTTIDFPADGFVIGGVITNDETQNFTWTGLTERVEGSIGTADFGAADDTPLTSTANKTVSVSTSGSGVRMSMAVASFR